MNRQDLLHLLDEYETRHPDEVDSLRRIRKLLAERERAFHRDCFEPGHITSSAWIVSRESGAALLTHHRKLERWLQLGGHVDGETDVLAGAFREANEESGLEGFRAIPIGGPPQILDVDVHVIPAHKDEPAHRHHDIRFLLEVSENQKIDRQIEESKEVRWFTNAELRAQIDEESVLRMQRKSELWLSRRPSGPA